MEGRGKRKVAFHFGSGGMDGCCTAQLFAKVAPGPSGLIKTTEISVKFGLWEE